MKLETRFLFFFKQFFLVIKQKLFFFEKNFSIALFFLFLGFIFGNLFGTFLNKIRSYIVWDGFTILILIILFETISFFTYHKKHNLKKKFFWTTANYFKIGLMFGFFIDAFKVGS